MTTASTPAMDFAALSGGLLISRLMLGLSMAAHGAQKLFGWFHGPGLAGTGGMLERLGFRPGKPYAAADGCVEMASGLLVAFGLFGPIGPALMISGMVVAIVSVHWRNGFFATNNGFETPLLYAMGALALAFTGFGQYSLDAALGLRELGSPTFAAIAVIVGAFGGFAMLAVRHPPPPKATEMHG